MPRAGKSRSYELIFSVNGQQVTEQLNNIDKSLGKTQSEYRMIKKNLESGFDPQSFKRGQEILSQAVDQAAKKVEILTQKLREMENEGITDANRAAFDQLNRELVDAKNKAAQVKDQLEEINNIRMDRARSEIQKVGKQIDDIGKKLSIGLTTPLVAAGAYSVNASADMTEAINKVQVTFGDAADSVLDFTNNTLRAYGIAKSTSADMTAYFGDMAVSAGFSRDEAAQLSMTLVGLAGDLASFKNISLDQAQTALAGIFTGETESLKQLGVIMTQTNLQAFAASKGIETTVSEMSQYEQTALRLQYVLENTVDAQGDFGRTSDSTANRLRLLQESLKELAVIAGNELVPIVTPIIAQITEIIQWLGELDDGTKQLITRVALMAAAFGPLLTVTNKVFTGLRSGWQTLKGVKAAYKTYMSTVEGATRAQAALNAVQSASPAGALTTAITMAVAALGSYLISGALAAENTESLSKKVKELGESFDEASESINQTATEETAELEFAEKLIPKFEELNGKVDKTAAEKLKLKGIVDQINEVLPDTIELLDEEKGLYSALPDEIYKTIEARKQEIQMIAKRDRALEAAKAQASLLDELGYNTLDDLKLIKNSAEAAYAREYQEALDEAERASPIWKGSLKAKINADVMAWAYVKRTFGVTKDDLDALKEAIKQYEEYEKIINEYTSTGGSLSGSSSTEGFIERFFNAAQAGATSATSAIEGSEDKLKEEADLALNEIEYLYKSNQITLQEYIKRLTQYRDKYLKDNIKSWRSTTLTIQDLKEQLAEEEQKRIEEEKERLEELAEAEREAQEQRIADAKELADAVIAAAEAEANAKIAAIDAELAARKKLQEEEDRQLKLEQAMAQLAFTRDEESRASLKQEIARLQEEIEEARIEEEAEAKKEQIQAEIDAIKEKANAAVSQMQINAGTERVNPYIQEIAPNLTINVAGMTAAQIQQLIDNAIYKATHNL